MWIIIIFYFVFWTKYRGKNRAMKFSIQQIWREPSDYSHNCIFRMMDHSKDRPCKNIPVTIYPDFRSSSASVPQTLSSSYSLIQKTEKISCDTFRMKEKSWDSFAVLVLGFLEIKSPKTMLSMLRHWWRYIVKLASVCT